MEIGEVMGTEKRTGASTENGVSLGVLRSMENLQKEAEEALSGLHDSFDEDTGTMTAFSNSKTAKIVLKSGKSVEKYR